MLNRANRSFDGRTQILSVIQVFEAMPAALGCPDLFWRGGRHGT
jgi:hypothetical protein